MDINEFSALPRERQWEEASRISGMPVSTLDGVWRTESSRGVHMLSPAGAKGHFGLMDATRSAWERRFGTTIDPDNFGQSLFTAAHTLQENKRRFKNDADALRAYNGGWEPAKWGNPETAAYVAKVLGQDADTGSTAVEAVARPAKASVEALYEQPFAKAAKLPSTAQTPVSKAAQAVAEGKVLSPFEPDPLSYNVWRGTTQALADEQLKQERLKEQTSFGDMVGAAWQNALPYQLVQRLSRDPEPETPGYVVPEELFKGLDEGEQRELATATSDRQATRILSDFKLQKERDEITFRDGAFWGIAASLIAAAPQEVLAGKGIGLAFRGAAISSYQLAKAGQKAGALASAGAEGVIGGVATTAALDMLGQRQSPEAYAFGVVGGPLNLAVSGRGIGRTADAAQEAQTAARLLQQTAERETARIAEARKRLPEGAPDEDVAAMVTQIEAEQMRADKAAHTAAVPESRKFNLGNTEDDLAEDVKAVAKADEAAAQELRVDPVQALRDEFDTPEAKVAPKWESPDFAQARKDAYLMRDDWERDVAAASNGIVNRTTFDVLPAGVTVSKEAAESVPLRKPIAQLKELAEKYLQGDKVVIGTETNNPKASGVVYSIGDVHVIGIKPGMPSATQHSAWHEFGHAVYHKWAPHAPKELLARVDAEWGSFVERAKKSDPKAWAGRWAGTSPNAGATPQPSPYALSRDEYMAEQFVKHLQNKAMSGQLGGRMSPRLIDELTQAVHAVMDYIRDLIGLGVLKPGKAADEFFTQVLEGAFNKAKISDELLAPDLRLPDMEAASFAKDAIPPALAKDVENFLTDPTVIRHGLDRLPLATPAQRAEAKAILNVYKRAESPEYVVDEKRMNRILKNFPSLDPTSNIMLRSKNPVVRMAAIELLENGGGAGGRRSTASIAKYMNERAIIGSSVVELDQAFRGWAKDQAGYGRIKETFSGEYRARFNRLVAEEIEQRRYPDARTDFGANVRAAADTVEAAFDRARRMQVDAKVAGWGALPETSVGYMPHRMKSNVYRNLTLAQKRALHAELTDQFITVSEFDPAFADQLASKYLDRVEHRALGGFDAPMGIHQTGAADTVREALEQMNMTRDQVDAMMKRYVKGAASHTKKRLNLDLRKPIQADDGTSFVLMDLYDTDMLSLLRGQSQRVSGEVALARHGIYGKPGMSILRRAMGFGADGAQATKDQVDAFDQVTSEFLGLPFGTSNKWVDRAVQFNSLSSLGGMGFNQMGEIINVGMTMGWKAALQNVAAIGRLSREVRVLAKGGKVEDSLLHHIETMGGAEFGTDAYKLVFPLDNPDLFNNSLGPESINAGDRLLRTGIHAQGILSGWRVLHATQVRGAAEQIVLKTARLLKEGSADFHMRDMGIDDDMLKRLQKDMQRIVKMRDGKVVGFDITKATDTEAAHAYIQAVHRGASQMIQGTFVGETGKYVHNSYLRLLAQFRGFGLTAIDKQFRRQVGNRGMTGAVLLSLGAMSVAAPLHMARVYAASLGRADQDEYLDKHMQFGAVAKATTNYIATSGLAGDFLEAVTAVTGTSEYTGGRSGTATTAVGNLIAPAAGKVDKLWGAVQNTAEGTDPMALIKELPMSRLPYIIPAMNALAD